MSAAVRVVYDCNMLLQGLASPTGPAGRCVQSAIDGAVELVISDTVLAELRDVSSRPVVIAKLKLRADRVAEFFEMLSRIGTELNDAPELFAQGRDPSDAHYVNLALAAGASLVVSRDRDLLDLMEVSRPEARDFQGRFPTIRIITPVQLLQELAT